MGELLLPPIALRDKRDEMVLSETGAGPARSKIMEKAAHWGWTIQGRAGAKQKTPPEAENG